MYEKRCAHCGTTTTKFYQTGMLGCPNCYAVFTAEIISALKKVQGSIYHAGKTPRVTGLDRELLLEYQSLIKEKETASIKGEFYRVKELSEQILDLAEELKKRGII